MRHVVYPQEPLRRFAERGLAPSTFTNLARMLGVECEGRLAAVVVFDRFTKTDCEISVASDGSANWLDRRVMVRIAAYPFVQLKLDRVTAFVEAENAHARRFVCRLGFVHEGMKRHPDSLKQVMMFGLLRSDCAWVPLQLLAA